MTADPLVFSLSPSAAVNGFEIGNGKVEAHIKTQDLATILMAWLYHR